MQSLSKLLILIYIPWILSEIIQFNPMLSYLIAWTGSFLIFYLSIFSPLRHLSCDLPLVRQIMRPIVLVQLIFAGFMCCTSIFYFMDNVNSDLLNDIAKCQRLSLLAHAGLTSGIVLAIKPRPEIRYRLNRSKNLLFKLCLICFLISELAGHLPALIQFKYTLLAISVTCSAYIFVKGLVKHTVSDFAFGVISFSIIVLNSTLTGYKESLIVNVILIGFLIFPYYKKTVIFLSFPCIYVLLYILPTFTTVIRMQSWFGGKPKEIARQAAYQFFFDENNEEQISINNHEFLTNRLSEISMFTQYVKQVPEWHPYYGSEILINSFYALIPRFLWTKKPNTEKIAMERVYELKVVNRLSTVSAKTRPIVDGYLSAGIPGVFFTMLIYGLATQWLCNTSEKLFGGYQMGCIIIFNSVFQQLWRGNTFEFLLNNIIYGCVLTLIIFVIMKLSNVLIQSQDEHYTN